MWLPIAVAVLLLLLLAVSRLAFRVTMSRPKAPDLSDPGVLMSSEFFAYAQRLKPALQWFSGRHWAPVGITAADGATLKGQWLPAKKPVGSILLLHGYAASPLHMAPVARWAEKRQLSVLAVSQRAHGESGGQFTSLGLLESEDARLWAEKLRELAGADAPMVLYGSGMGGAAVLLSLTRALPGNVVAAVSEGGYPSVKALMKHTIRQEYRMRVFPLLQLLCLWGRLYWKVRVGKADARLSLKEATIPLLLTHGKEDLRVPASMSKEAHDACAGPKKLLLWEKAGHGACTLAEPELYFGELDNFLLPLLKNWQNSGKSAKTS